MVKRVFMLIDETQSLEDDGLVLCQRCNKHIATMTEEMVNPDTHKKGIDLIYVCKKCYFDPSRKARVFNWVNRD